MNLIQRAKEFLQKRFTLKDPPRWFIHKYGLEDDFSINSRSGLAIKAVYISAKILGEAISTIPVQSIQRNGNNRIQVNDDISYFMGVSAWEEGGVTASDFWKAVMVHICTHGNAVAYIERNVRGRIMSIQLLKPWDYEIHWHEGNIIYKTYNGMGILHTDDVLHFKGISWDGKCGVSPIREQMDLMHLSQKVGSYAKRIYGKKVPGYISTDSELRPDQVKQVSLIWSSQVTGDEFGGTPVLGAGMKYVNVPMNPVEIDYIKTSNITDKDIFSMYRIPPTLAQDFEKATFSNAEQQDLIMVKYTLLPYFKSFEQEMTMKLYPVSNRTSANPMRAKFNVNAFLRADYKTRAEGNALMWERGIINKNEWRSMEDLNPVEGGDDYYVMVNMQREKDIDRNLAMKSGENSLRHLNGKGERIKNELRELLKEEDYGR